MATSGKGPPSISLGAPEATALFWASYAFFDFPGLDLGPYLETLGNVNHIAISVTRDKWEYLRGKLDAAGVEYHTASGTSIYFKDPDGVRLELLADPFGEMYGTKVL